MSYTITRNCISCQRCLSACPTGAIQTNGTAFWIAVNRCTQCKGSHGVPQCWAVCPTNEGCVPLTAGALTTNSDATADYWDSWFATYTSLLERLKASPQSSYWRRWFDAYSQSLKSLQAQYNPEVCAGGQGS
ncbi:4Fe-4S dicluster domain-containing protein [Nodosilinea nodulosa]|uniref:4Fe-4S dicluster domain-containing protein n=1 Tax=Nodosilinea nodulosa TaxID=416001 RepID=UPI0002DAA279|nr:4Fe-4S dicluster domain-containing protein [Nodosilinea nodulosa]